MFLCLQYSNFQLKYFQKYIQQITKSMGCQSSSLQTIQANNEKENGRNNRIKKQGKVNERIAIQQLNTQNVTKTQIDLASNDIKLAQNALTDHYLFYKLSSTQRKNFIQSLQIYTTNKNQYVFRKGQTATMFFIIKSGTLAVELNNQEKDIKKLGPGDSFGELALMYTAPRSASVKTLENCQFLCISHHVFRKTIQQIVKRNFQLAKSSIDKITLFKYLTSKQKTNLAYYAHSLKYSKNDIIFKQGDDANSFFVILSGSIKVQIPSKNPITMNQGQSFGQNSFKKGQVRSGTAICQQKVHLLAISRQSISKCLGGEFRELIFYNIMKWSLKRIALFKNCSNLVLQKIITKCEIRKFKNGQTIIAKNQPVNSLILCLQGAINGKQPGTIFNAQFLVNQDIQVAKSKHTLVKQVEGFICFLKFSFLEKLFGGSLFDIVRKNAARQQVLQLQVIKQHQYQLIKLNQLNIIKKLGEGQFGTVYQVEDHSGEKYALKCIDKQKIIQNQMQSFIQQQRDIFQNLQNSFIVSCYRTFKDRHNIYFLLKLIEGRDFFDILREIGLLDYQVATFYLGCLILAIQYLHQKNIVYRDLKPQNAVVDKKGYLTMIDMGTSKFLSQQNGYRTFTIIGTPHYMAPQVVQGKGYSFSVDIWALGVMLYQMVCGNLPYGENVNDPVDIYKEIIKTKLKFPKYYDDQIGKQLIKKLLIREPELRSIEQFAKLKNNLYFQHMDWEKLAKKKITPPFMSNSKDSRDETKINMKVGDFMKQNKKKTGKSKVSQIPNWDQKF